MYVCIVCICMYIIITNFSATYINFYCEHYRLQQVDV